MPRREHRPVLPCRVKDRSVPPQTLDDTVGQRGRLALASLAEDDGDPSFEVDVTPLEAVTVVVSRVGEHIDRGEGEPQAVDHESKERESGSLRGNAESLGRRPERDTGISHPTNGN
jgi:hypothetical protein